MVSRRTLLGQVGTLVTGVTAGCLSGQHRSESTETSTQSPSATQPSTTPSQTSATPSTIQSLTVGDSVALPAGQSTVQQVRARRLITPLDASGVHTQVVGTLNRQFVVVSLTATDPVTHQTARDAVSLSLPPETYQPASHYFPPNDFGGFDVAFSVPAPTDATTGELVWKTDTETVAQWSLPNSVLQALRSPPQFTVESLAVPSHVSAGASVTAQITVTNTGRGQGLFRAELGPTTISDSQMVEFRVDAGQTLTQTVPVRIPTNADESVTVVLDWGVNRLTRTLTITK